MTLQGNIRIEYNDQAYDLNVKTILLKGVYYFFITDHEKGHPLLYGETIELVYADGFLPGDKKVTAALSTMPPELTSAIKNTLLTNKNLWFYCHE